MSQTLPDTPRRGFLGGLAAGTAALIIGKWSHADAEIVSLAASAPINDEWVGRIKGKYKQVFDVTSADNVFGSAYALNFIDSTKEATKAPDSEITAVTVFRHMSMPMMLNDKMWAKYKIGEVTNVKDPKTNAPAVRNIFRDNVMLRPGLTLEREMSERGVIFVACNMALTVFSGMAAPKAGVTADVAKKEWTANLLPGVHLSASGVYAVNRAQSAGCTYCYAG